MAILIEGTSVVIKRSSINEKFEGGWQTFLEDMPHNAYCFVQDIVRVTFMSPVDVRSYVKRLERFGLVYMQDGHAQDLVIVDQLSGMLAPCRWAEFGRVTLVEANDALVAVCRAVGTSAQEVSVPDGWSYEGTLSHTYAFTPTEHIDKSLVFLRHDNGLDVYLNKLTGEEVYVGRTGEW